MNNKTLAIRGDKERGNEVIALLEMLGGNNSAACGDNEKLYYFIGVHNIIDADDLEYNGVIIFTLDEFYKKFPFKIGDTVYLVNGDEVEIVGMKWEESTGEVLYTYVQNGNNFNIYASYINSKKTEDMKIEGTLRLVDGFNMTNPKIEIDLNEYEYKVDDNKLIIQKKQLYPKTYEECCEVLGCKSYSGFHAYGSSLDKDYDAHYWHRRQFESLYKLCICRDAYWKIAGEEMGLDKPWEPDLTNDKQEKYMITYFNNRIEVFSSHHSYVVGRRNHVLSFPSDKVRDIFYENFADDINNCKKLL